MQLAETTKQQGRKMKHIMLLLCGMFVIVTATPIIKKRELEGE